MRRERAAVRLLLLVAVVLGLGWMHTLGHQVHVNHSAMGTMSTPPPVSHDVMRDGPAIAPATPAAPDTEMCLAVLAATVLLAVAMLTAYVRRDADGGTTRAAARPAGRDPPRARPFSLLYAELTVLRI